MPRYYFHTAGSQPFLDKDGVELADDDTAWSTAVSSCGELLLDLDGKLPSRFVVTMQVSGESERCVATPHLTGRRYRQEL